MHILLTSIRGLALGLFHSIALHPHSIKSVSGKKSNERENTTVGAQWNGVK